ncbi:MAG: S24 family peptidase, partial [Cyanobacteria bacterium P01_F01_bin.53]
PDLLKPDPAPTQTAPSQPALSVLKSIAFSKKGLPVLGEIAAGHFHQPFTDEIDEYLDISYSGRKNSDYVLRISGKSMIGAGIPDGAYVGIRPVPKDYHPRPGEIVAVWVDGEGATLKHYYQKDSTVVLEAANPDYKPIILDLTTTEVTVQGTHIFTHWQTPGIV